MRLYLCIFSVIIVSLSIVMGLPDVPGLKIEVLNPEIVSESKRKTKRGDKIDVHYSGSLEKDGTVFDSSYNRNQPLSFTVGNGQVIKGWDEGLLEMQVGEKRKLTIAPELAYGANGYGPIPAAATLSKSISLSVLSIFF